MFWLLLKPELVGLLYLGRMDMYATPAWVHAGAAWVHSSPVWAQ